MGLVDHSAKVVVFLAFNSPKTAEKRPSNIYFSLSVYLNLCCSV